MCDIFRTFLCHRQSSELLSRFDAGECIFKELADDLKSQDKNKLKKLVFEILTNAFIKEANKKGLLKFSL